MSRKWLSLLLAALLVLGVAGGLVGCTSAPKADASGASNTSAPASDTSAADAARAKLLISVADLAKDPASFVILDSRDPKAYAAGHIEGAISAPWQTFADMKGTPGEPAWGTLLPPQGIADALGKLGVDTAKPVVIYSDPTGWGEDGRVLWTMQAIGLEGRLLDGGYPAWTAGGNAPSTKAVKATPTTVAVVKDNYSAINVTTDEVKQAVDTSSAAILDVRSTKEYDGATDFGEKRGGHIPGAVNVPFPTVFNEDGTVKSNADLEAMYSAAGLTKDKPIDAYCTKGIRSAYVFELLQMLGYTQAKNYDASYYAWAGDSKLPIVK